MHLVHHGHLVYQVLVVAPEWSIHGACEETVLHVEGVELLLVGGHLRWRLDSAAWLRVGSVWARSARFHIWIWFVFGWLTKSSGLGVPVHFVGGHEVVRVQLELDRCVIRDLFLFAGSTLFLVRGQESSAWFAVTPLPISSNSEFRRNDAGFPVVLFYSGRYFTPEAKGGTYKLVLVNYRHVGVPSFAGHESWAVENWRAIQTILMFLK